MGGGGGVVDPNSPFKLKHFLLVRVLQKILSLMHTRILTLINITVNGRKPRSGETSTDCEYIIVGRSQVLR